MLQAKPYLRFVLRFMLAFALLALPWPHWMVMWRAITRIVAHATLARTSSAREVGVDILQPPANSTDLRFTIINRSLMNADGSGPERHLDLSVSQIEMRPLALFFALLFATSLSWKKRIAYLVVGAVLLQISILAVLSFCIWRESMELLLVTTSIEMKALATAVRDGLVQYSGLVLPVAIWLLLCVRRNAGYQTSVVLGSLKPA